MADLLTDDEVEAALPSGWQRSGDEIVRTYEFDDYLAGVTFAVHCAEIAEEEWHHPEMTIGYGAVEIRLTSHEAGGLTDKDIEMAKRFDESR